ncbi:serine/arginine repetitive matrix protein 2-like isoform X3 [Varroa jacobsoni]|uniref:Uncharacterized protein n=1 Tax=Varroa destructor TaxID=109461 RepID=A0A7M7JV65_VARDE|nr:serine/arginine repetitive matrix protein 2-like isoform X3 [Varroa destructor]XP_022706568.1 serine/arginine repetitive matrix protein 2-like isoform X3 [Varroa jacobsoni]
MNTIVDCGGCWDVERRSASTTTTTFHPSRGGGEGGGSSVVAASSAARRSRVVNALTDGDDQPSEVCLPPVLTNPLVQHQHQHTAPLSTSAARRKRRKRRPRSNSALLAALPSVQRDMFRSLWRATLQAFIQTQQTQGALHAGHEEDLNHSLNAVGNLSQRQVERIHEIDANSVRDPVIRRVVKEKGHSTRNVFLETEPIERPDKSKKRLRRSRSCSSGSSSSDSEAENSEHSSDHGVRKKSRRSKKRKKDKHKGKKKSRRESSYSGDERRKRHHHHHSKERSKGNRADDDDRQTDSKHLQQRHKSRSNDKSRRDESRKPRGDEVCHSDKNVPEQKFASGASKLSFSPLCDEEPTEEKAIDYRASDKNHVELLMKLPSKKVVPGRWLDEDETHKPEADLTGTGSSSKAIKAKTPNGNEVSASKQIQEVPEQSGSIAIKGSPRSVACEKLVFANQHSDSLDAEERLLNNDFPKSLRIQPTAKKNFALTTDAAVRTETDQPAGPSKGRSLPSTHHRMSLSRQSSSSPDCAKIRKLLASKKVTSPDTPSSNVSGTSNGRSDLRNGSRSPPTGRTGSHSRSRSNSRSRTSTCAGGDGIAGVNGVGVHFMNSTTSCKEPELSKWEKSDALPAAYRSRSNSLSKSRSAHSLSRSRSRERSGGGRSRSHSRSRSRSGSARSRRSRSGSGRRSTSRRPGSRGRSRSYSRSSYSSRSRSRSRRYSSRSRSRSYTRSRSRSRSPSIPRRAGSPSFLDKRRITRAPDGPSWRKRRRQSSSWDSRYSRSSKSLTRSWSSTSTRSNESSSRSRRRRRRHSSSSSTSSGY